MTRLAAQLVVIAKAPVPGLVKTRLTPPFTPQEAARLAEAALADTLEAGARAPFARRVLALAGASATLRSRRGHPPRAGWLPPGFEVTGQRGQGLDERIAAAFDDAYARLPVPVVLVGMDTPQVTPGLLERVTRPLARGEADAVFGPARDGGFWLLGLRRPDPGLILGVPMSQTHTGRGQLSRLLRASLRVRLAPELIDVDTAADADEVARQAPGSRFAATLLGISGERGPDSSAARAERDAPAALDADATLDTKGAPLAGAGSGGR
jgi:rSAM/selenodomain-associated transferase 1